MNKSGEKSGKTFFEVAEAALVNHIHFVIPRFAAEDSTALRVDPGEQFVGGFAMQHVQEMSANGVVIGFRFNPYAIMAVAIPVNDDGRK